MTTTDEQLIAKVLEELERKELKAIKVKQGKFVRTFKSGSKAEILQMMDENFSWDNCSDLNKFKVGQIVEVCWEYADGYCSILSENYYELYIPTNFLKSINN